MARHKERWTGDLFSYGPVYINGRVVGFNVTIKVDDHTDSSRYVDIPITESQLRRMADTAEEIEDRELTP